MRSSFSRLVAAAVVLVPLALFAPQSASAQSNGTVPSGNSAISEYLESIPTASGGKSTTKIHRSHGGRSGAASPSGNGGSGTGTGGGGANGGGGGSGQTGALSSSSYRDLSSQGTIGAQDAAFARSTAPAAPRHSSTPGSSGASSSGAGSSGNSVSPASAVLKSLTGSASSGGLGALLPAILVLVAVAGGVVSLLRRRAHRAGS